MPPEDRYESVRKQFRDRGYRVPGPPGHRAGRHRRLASRSACSRETVSSFLRIAGFFLSYCILGYALLFFRFDRKRDIYRIFLLFDLAFVYQLIVHSGGFASGFFLGFYLLTALHSFYYGYRSGLIVAAVCAAIYLLACFRVSPIEPVDFLLRTTFLFLIALPIGLLSAILREDKEKIESLNRDLSDSLETMKHLQGKLVEVEKLSALGRLTADVAHEIRNPLTAIGGFAKRLEKRLRRIHRKKSMQRSSSMKWRGSNGSFGTR